MISRRDLLSAAATAAVLPAQSRQQQPNFIIFLADDLGSHDLGCQGATDVKTPNIDAIAANGARFTNWYANAPVCAPSRAALMTGRFPQRCGVPGNGQPLAHSEETIASLLKKKGYTTGIFGKWHLGNTDDTAPTGHGFDTFFGFHSGCIDFFSHRYYWGDPKTVNYHDLYRNRTEIFEDGQYMTELITREAKAFVAQNRNRPFFMYVPFNGVHYPMHAPKKYVERFAHLEPERRMYCAMLSAVDDGIGEILAEVKRAGQLDNTFVVFLADNGATTEARAGLNQQPATAGSNGIYKGFKFSLFDGGMHVPCVMSWPGHIAKGQTIHEVCMTADLLPTICKAAGQPLPADRTIDGKDISEVVMKKGRSPHNTVFWASAGQQAARRGQWKLVIGGRMFGRTPEERKTLEGDDAMWLSNLEKDPGEKVNLRHQYPSIVDELATAIKGWQDDVKKE